MSDTPTVTTSKRARAETESHGGDAQLPSSGAGATSPTSKPPPKRLKDALASEESSDESIDEPKPADDDGIDPGTQTEDGEGAPEDDGPDGLARLVHVINRQGSSGTLTATQKRARYVTRYGGMTSEAALVALQKTWRSPYYNHFRSPVIAIANKGGVEVTMHKFICKRFPSKSVSRAHYEDSTTNLKRHVELCDPEDVAETDMITSYAGGATYTPARFRYLLAMWCARHHRPFVLIEDQELCDIFKMLYAKVDIPSRFTISRDVRLLHTDSFARVVAFFQDLDGKIHLCVDGWTSPNVISFLGITAHWERDGTAYHIILDFVKLDQAHTGVYLAKKLAESLIRYKIEKRILAVTCDNAENNSTMMSHLELLIPQVRGRAVRVRCMAHVINLVVKAILSQFDPSRRERGSGAPADGDDDLDQNGNDEDDAGEDEESDGDEPDEAREAADALLIDELEVEEADDPMIVLTPEERQEGKNAFKKIMQLSKKVWHSPSIRSELGRLATEAKIPSRVLLRSVKTRWNTVTEVLGRALEMRQVLGHLCDSLQFNKPQGVRLRRFALTEEQWTLLFEMHQLLHPFLYATKDISTSGKALVHEVIPYFDVLTAHVDRFRRNVQMSPVVRGAAERGRRMLDKYYSFTDDSIIYRIAMILHPEYKLDYFKRVGWEQEWIDEASRVIREEWVSNYRPVLTAPPRGPRAVNPGHVSGAATAGSTATTTDTSRAMFSQMRINPDAPPDALEVYLESPPLATVEDPLAHWNSIYVVAGQERALRPGERALARMALDFLSIPAASTDAERAFSRGGLTVSKYRHSLAEESVRAATLIGSWSDIDELVPPEDAAAAIKKSMRKKTEHDHSSAAVKPTGSESAMAAPDGKNPSASKSASTASSGPRPRPKNASTKGKGKGKATAAESSASVRVKGKGKPSTHNIIELE